MAPIQLCRMSGEIGPGIACNPVMQHFMRPPNRSDRCSITAAQTDRPAMMPLARLERITSFNALDPSS
jgi:hypothetical protein